MELPVAHAGTAVVTLRVEQRRGDYAGASFPEPIRLDCGTGLRATGDWSRGTVLETYSGGARYRKQVVLSSDQARGRVRLDLGRVVATAEVRVDGRLAGIRVAPPWVVDLGDTVRAGTNRLEVLVYNTLANHYLTVPTKYRGSPESGLLGPVRLECRPETVLVEDR
ncbi:MAG: hypothetical protein JNL97_14825 [Verrucomicrobiales bacterium]|nr:hypothetical protein [Verrucomicrobiales bacterium]